MNDALTWLGIAICISQSALFSGSNIAVFSLSRLRLEAAAAAGDKSASSALDLRRDANFTLVTILIGNVAINVLLTMLADSVLAGVLAFLFSTVVITALGEIVPQAYFSRNALRAVSLFAPVLRIYRILLWPIAKPTALLLDAWVGTEMIPWFRERELHNILRYHADNTGSEVGRVEAIGATNFLALDDLVVRDQGEPLHPESVVRVPVADELGIETEWKRLGAFAALEGLERGDVDLAIGGFDRKAVTPVAGAAPSYAYFKEQFVVGARPDVADPVELEGRQVYVPRDLPLAELVRSKGGIPVDEWSDEVDLAAVPRWLLVAHDLRPTEIVLHRAQHVVAVRQGENAWLMRLERFLRRETDGMDARLRANAT